MGKEGNNNRSLPFESRAKPWGINSKIWKSQIVQMSKDS